MEAARPLRRPAVGRRVLSPAHMAPLLGLGAVLLVLGVWAWVRTRSGPDLAKNLITARVTRGDLVETVTATGSVTAQTGAQVKIGSQITGRIRRLYADVGTQVKSGQLIATLDLPDIQAQEAQAQANLNAAHTRLAQQVTGVPMQATQTDAAVEQARQALQSAEAKLQSAQAAARLQSAQTPTDIRRAETGLAASKAALSTAQSNLLQVQASADLQVATAQEQLNQAKANAALSSANRGRQEQLYKQGYIAASDLDAARAQDAVNASLVSAAQKNLRLVRQKVAADLQAARDQETQAEQNVAAAQAALTAAQAGKFADAQKVADVRDLQAQVTQAQENLRSAVAALTQNRLKQQDVEQARQAAAAAQAQLEYARAQVAKTEIRSPITGTVLQLAAQEGETIAAGLSAPTVIIVADLRRLEVVAYVDETDIGQVRIGQLANVTVDAFPRRVYHGYVSKIASGSTIQQGVVTYSVTIALADPGTDLKPDMSASITIRTGEHPNVLLVPAEAVQLSGSRAATVNVLVKRRGRSQVQQRQVVVGGTDGVKTEIRSGLKRGETVVLAGLDRDRSRRGPSSPFGPQPHGGGRGR